MFAYDEVSAIVVGLETGLHCALRADTLRSFVDLAGEEVTLEAEDNAVIFTSGRTRASLPSLPPEEFVFEEPRAANKTTMRFVATEEFLSALALCAAGVGKDPRFKAQTAVTLCTGKASAMYAFDGTSLVKAALPTPVGTEARQVLLPKSICDQIKGLMEALHCEPADVTVNLSKNHLSVEFAVEDWEVYLVGKLLSEAINVEAYEQVVTQATQGRKTLPVDLEFAKAVDKVSIVVANDVEKMCRLKVTADSLVVSGEGALGKASTEIDVSGGQKDEALVDPERLTRYRGLLTHIAVAKDRVAMYDTQKPEKATLTYVAACYSE